MFFGGGVVIKLGDEVIGGIGAVVRQEQSSMTVARAVAWTRFATGCSKSC